MARKTVTDVREKVNLINDAWIDGGELTFSCWGVERNKYQLMKPETGETFGPVCVGSSEFLQFLGGFKEGVRFEP